MAPQRTRPFLGLAEPYGAFVSLDYGTTWTADSAYSGVSALWPQARLQSFAITVSDSDHVIKPDAIPDGECFSVAECHANKQRYSVV